MFLEKESGNTWVDLRQNILHQVKLQVNLYTGGLTHELVSYEETYESEFDVPWVESSRDELLDEVDSSQIVYGADFHPYWQSQRSHLRVLRELPKDKSITVAFECFNVEHQHILDAFIDGELSSEQLRKKVRWEENWRFSWKNYEPLFLLAQERQWELLALSSRADDKKSLFERDDFAGQIIARNIKPEKLIYVLFGELHLAQPHLPEFVRCHSQSDFKEVTLHLSPEKIYFELAKINRELDYKVLRLSGGDFCIFDSPPWVKWQSYLSYLETNIDENVASGEYADQTDSMAKAIDFLSKELEVKIKSDKFTLFLLESREWDQVLFNLLPKSSLEILKSILSIQSSFYIAEKQAIYLSRLSVNNLAEGAGQYIHAYASKRSRTYFNLPFQYNKMVWIQAMSFFMSQLINPHRKPEKLKDLNIRFWNQRDVVEKIWSLSLNYFFEYELTLNDPRLWSSYFEAARVAGSHLGYKMFKMYRGGKISKADLRKWMEIDLDSTTFSKSYLEIIEKIHPQRGRFSI